MEFGIDAGSPYTIMGNDTVKRIFGCCVLDRSKAKIRSFTGHSVLVLGTMDVNVTFRDRLIEARIIVTELGVLTINLVKNANTVKATLTGTQSWSRRS